MCFDSVQRDVGYTLHNLQLNSVNYHYITFILSGLWFNSIHVFFYFEVVLLVLPGHSSVFDCVLNTCISRIIVKSLRAARHVVDFRRSFTGTSVFRVLVKAGYPASLLNLYCSPWSRGDGPLPPEHFPASS